MTSQQMLPRVIVFAAATISASLAHAQVFTTPTSFDESIDFNDSAAKAFGAMGDTPESISVDVAKFRTSSTGQPIEYEIVATMLTSGGVNPMIDIQGQLYANGLHHVNGFLRGRASGRIQYGVMVVEKTPPIVFVPDIPVVFETDGEVSATAPMRASVSVTLPNQSPISINSDSGPREFRHRFITMLRPGAERLIRLQASADFPTGASLQQGTIEFQAVVDPIIYIDPSFEFADNYEVLFSSAHIEAGPIVPEPDSVILLLCGLGVAACASIRRRLV